jgi:hypothetical protein
MPWDDDQQWESEWWGDCANTFVEETKQITYAEKMGLDAYFDYGKYPVYDLNGKSILDIGGGPVSMLLKCVNFGRAVVVDPCNYPDWVDARYKALNIEYKIDEGENLIDDTWKKAFDEVWIYNVLQHTHNPELIIKNARNAGQIIRIFEWIDLPPCVGHPQMLKEKVMNEWLGGTGETEFLDGINYCDDRAYYGVFKT